MVPQLPHEADGDDEALECPSQLPQDEEGVPSDAPLPLPQDDASAAAGVVCQLPQLPESPCLSRFSATPARTELVKASRTNEPFTILGELMLSMSRLYYVTVWMSWTRKSGLTGALTKELRGVDKSCSLVRECCGGGLGYMNGWCGPATALYLHLHGGCCL